jgi:phosphatidylserine decarboxylase
LRLDRAGWPFIGGALLLALISEVAVGWGLALPLTALAAFFAFFFRDPDRRSPSDEHLVLSPADGRVLIAGAAVPEAAPPGAWQQISIFL